MDPDVTGLTSTYNLTPTSTIKIEVGSCCQKFYSNAVISKKKYGLETEKNLMIDRVFSFLPEKC